MVALPCDCDSECPGCLSCAVMLVHDPHGWCESFCGNCPEPLPHTIKGSRRPVMSDDLIDFDMRNASLGEAAQLLARGAYSEIFVPANRIDERRDLRLESVRLDTVLRELGLMAVEPTEPETNASPS